jgi:hypothetical protein
VKIFIDNPIKKEGDFEFNSNVISNLNYRYFLKKKPNLFDYFKGGYSNSSISSKLINPHYLNRLYLEKDKDYFRFLNTFYEKYKEYDVIVMTPGENLVHPEFLHKNFKNSLKVISCVDDPHCTYSSILPFAWVFDAAIYISPSYSPELNMKDLLNLAGIKLTFWCPLTFSNRMQPKWTVAELEKQLKTRKKQAVYFGNFYLNKIDRLINLKKKLKNNFEIYGKFPLKGFSFFIYSLLKKNPVMYLPKSYSSAEERDKIYEKIAIGINMHLSHPAIETGNARTYELAYNGVAQIVDSSKVSLINKIFEPNKEILTYENIDECIYQTKRLIEDDDLRCKIALAGYKKAIKEYSYDKTLKNLISWFEELTN